MQNFGRKALGQPSVPIFRPAQYLSVMLGVIMPLFSAWLYNSYYFWLPSPFLEWTRLQELPFVACEAIFIGWAIVRGMELRYFTSRLPLDCLIALSIFMLGLWGSTLFVSAVPLTSMTISLSYVIHLLFGCSIYFLLKDHALDQIDDVGFGLTCGLAALAIVTAWKFALPPAASSLYMHQIQWQAALPGFINVRHFGSWTGAVAAIFAGHLLCRRDSERVDWHDLAYLLAIGMTIWSGTRAAILAIGVACLILLTTWRTMPNIRTIGRLAILTGLGATIAYVLVPSGDPTFQLFSSSDGYRTVDQITSLRGTLWSLTYAEWLKAPWFGWGSGSTFWQVPFPNWHHTQPHNFVLQFLVSWGIVGASGALWLLGRGVVAVHQRAKAHPLAWPLVTGLDALLIMAGLEGMLHYPRFIMLIMVLFAMIFSVTTPVTGDSALRQEPLSR